MPRLVGAPLAAAVIALAFSGAMPPADLKPATLAAFDRYVALTEARMETEIASAAPYWIDRQVDPGRKAILNRLKLGEIVSARLETRDGKSEIDVPDGLIHHWVGTALMPRARMDRALTFVRDYARYPTYFSPLIQRTRILRNSGDHFDVNMRTWTKKIITVVMDADYSIDYRAVSPTRVMTRNVASNLYEVEDAGTPQERRTPTEKGAGYLWRFNTYCWFDERAEGIYEQCESISLTRDVPFGFGWIIKPFITSIPRETLEFMLGQVQKALK